MDLSRIDLNLLVAFDALLAERHVTRAAARLSVGQSAMSSTLSRLRTLLNDPILIRQGRELVATPLAESLVEPVREALAQVEALLTHREKFEPTTTRRTLSIMSSDYVTMIFLHPLLMRLADEAPNVTLHIIPGGSDAADRLWRNEVDLLIHPAEVFPEIDKFESAVLFTDRYVAAVDGANKGIGDTISLQEFTTQPYLATTVADNPSFAEFQLEAQGIKVEREITASATLAPFLLRGTQYTTLILGRLARYAAGEVNLRILEPPMPLKPVTEMMIWTARNTSDPAHQWLRARLRRLVEELKVD